MAITYEPIQTYTSTGNISTVSFSSISQAYTDLKIIFSAPKQTANANMLPFFRFNSDSNNIYSGTTLYGKFGDTYNYESSSPGTRFTPAAYPVDEDYPVYYEIDILGYSGTSVAKNVLLDISGRMVTSEQKAIYTGLFNSTNAVTSVQIFDAYGSGFGAYTTATLYGILKA